MVSQRASGETSHINVASRSSGEEEILRVERRYEEVDIEPSHTEAETGLSSGESITYTTAYVQMQVRCRAAAHMMHMMRMSMQTATRHHIQVK